MLTLRAAASQARTISAKNQTQYRYIEMLSKERPYIVVASGHAGTGKSLLATSVGIDKLRSGEVSKMIITRPAVTVEDEAHGFLPGTLEQKMEPWIRPITDVIEKRCTKDEIARMVKNKKIEIVPLAYMRGRTFENSWIICDEAQNCTPNQMLMLLTRIGENSKVVITGDPFQHDRRFKTNGLSDLLDKILVTKPHCNDISYIYFDEYDVVRHPVISCVLDMYGKSDE